MPCLNSHLSLISPELYCISCDVVSRQSRGSPRSADWLLRNENMASGTKARKCLAPKFRSFRRNILLKFPMVLGWHVTIYSSKQSASRRRALVKSVLIVGCPRDHLIMPMLWSKSGQHTLRFHPTFLAVRLTGCFFARGTTVGEWLMFRSADKQCRSNRVWTGTNAVTFPKRPIQFRTR